MRVYESGGYKRLRRGHELHSGIHKIEGREKKTKRSLAKPYGRHKIGVSYPTFSPLAMHLESIQRFENRNGRRTHLVGECQKIIEVKKVSAAAP
jgi:hypothetical protein